MRCREARSDIGASAEAGIEQAHLAQPVERRLIKVEPLRLVRHLAIPAEAQPFEVAKDRLDMLGPAAGAVDILDPQAEAPAMPPREVVRLDRRIGVAEVQATGGTGRESRVDKHQTGP
jgi:hypothetical protein